MEVKEIKKEIIKIVEYVVLGQKEPLKMDFNNPFGIKTVSNFELMKLDEFTQIYKRASSVVDSLKEEEQ